MTGILKDFINSGLPLVEYDESDEYIYDMMTWNMEYFFFIFMTSL